MAFGLIYGLFAQDSLLSITGFDNGLVDTIEVLGCGSVNIMSVFSIAAERLGRCWKHCLSAT